MSAPVFPPLSPRTAQWLANAMHALGAEAIENGNDSEATECASVLAGLRAVDVEAVEATHAG